MAKKTKNAELQPQVHVFDLINFNNIMHVKGHAGLWTLRSNPNKTGFCGLMKVGEFDKTLIKHAKDILPLSKYVFFRECGFDDLGIKTVFKTIFDWEVLNNKEFKTLDSADQMKICVPNYDDDKFTFHHMVRVLEFYNIILNFVNYEKRDKGADIGAGITE